jgi:hypothetical protein
VAAGARALRAKGPLTLVYSAAIGAREVPAHLRALRDVIR